MPRQLRLEYPGAIYHVMSRANGKGNIFETDVDRQDFVKTLAETCAKTGFEVHAYCLMRNHFHLVVETPQGNLVAGMRVRHGTVRQERSREIGAGGAVAPGNNPNAAVDFGPAAYGNLEEPQCEAASMEESERDSLTDRSRL